jgi:hypothetical protein
MAQFRSMSLLVALLLFGAAWTNPITAILEVDPANSAALVEHYNISNAVSQANILGARSISDPLSARQASCPNPSTNSLCDPNFCFIYQQNNDGTAWATCCPQGWSLQLNAADWSTEKCVLGSTKQPPSRPVSCGGSINGVLGTTSGWACVYSNEDVNVAGGLKQSPGLAMALALAWLARWLC